MKQPGQQGSNQRYAFYFQPKGKAANASLRRPQGDGYSFAAGGGDGLGGNGSGGGTGGAGVGAGGDGVSGIAFRLNNRFYCSGLP